MSIQPTHMCFGCVDVANNARTLAYHDWACRTGRYEDARCIPRLPSWVCMCPADGEITDFTDPATDGVCWYDPLIPESADFLGVIVRRVSGLRDSTFTREVLEGISGGSILQQPKILGKQLSFEAYIVATSEAGMDYGIEWLRRQLETDTRCPKDGTTCASCQGQAMTLRLRCPDEDNFDNGLHQFISAGTIDGVKLIEDEFPLGRHCCYQLRVITFTLQTESADSYSAEPTDSQTVTAADEAIFGRLGACADDVVDDGDDCCPFCHETCNSCTSDPACDCFPPYVLVPETIGTTAPCFTDPVCRCVAAVCATDLPSGYDSAFRFEMFAGYDPNNVSFTKFGLRNVVVRVYENPNALPCPEDDETYEALVGTVVPCAEIGVSWMPPASTLTIDGLSGKSWLSCNGECFDHSSRVATLSGSLFPLKARCTDLVFVVEFDCLNTQESDEAGALPSSVTVHTYTGFKL